MFPTTVLCGSARCARGVRALSVVCASAEHVEHRKVDIRVRVQPRWDFRSRAHPLSSSVSADPEESFAPRTLRRLSHRADGRLTDTRRRQRRGQVAPVAQIDEPTESGTSGAQRGRRRGPLSGRRYMQRPARQEQEDSAEGSGRGHVTPLANGAPPRDNFYPPSLDASTQLRFRGELTHHPLRLASVRQLALLRPWCTPMPLTSFNWVSPPRRFICCVPSRTAR